MNTVVALREPEPETRVALVPEVVTQLVRTGLRVVVQSGAGTLSLHSDDAYREAGAVVATGRELAEELGRARVLAHVRPLDPVRIAALPPGMITIGLTGVVEPAGAPVPEPAGTAHHSPAAGPGPEPSGAPASALAHDAGGPAMIEALNAARITTLSFEKLPRTSRAQAMDVLSSQSFTAGYRAVLEAAIRLPRFFPLAMTAAGTVPPAKVIVLGVGVAGLQAIATARRLGAKVAANDIRPESAEEVRSVGADFIDVGLTGPGTGGYARALDTAASDTQQQILAGHIIDADVLITTAAVPGRPAPRLVSAATVAGMRPGSVVVDLAAATGGNVEGARPGVTHHLPSTRGGGDVTVVGVASAPSDVPVDASRLFARNVANVLAALTDEHGDLTANLEDDLIGGMCLTHAGRSR